MKSSQDSHSSLTSSKAQGPSRQETSVRWWPALSYIPLLLTSKLQLSSVNPEITVYRTSVYLIPFRPSMSRADTFLATN